MKEAHLQPLIRGLKKKGVRLHTVAKSIGTYCFERRVPPSDLVEIEEA